MEASLRLRTSSCDRAGFTRVRCGRGFRYRDAEGRPVTDPDAVARIRACWADDARLSLPRDAFYARSMTEIASPHIANPRIIVLGVQPTTPPFRIVEIDGEVVGEARTVTDVLEAAAAFGITVHDLDDPDVVRWVGGDKFTWTRH